MLLKKRDAGDWLSWRDSFKAENEQRLNTNPDSLCSYGVSLLDSALFRIAKNELVVIGADSGSGKSELGLSIARYNAKNGKTVAVFYLEGGHQEAIARMKWRDISDAYYGNMEFRAKRIDMNYQKWILK